MLFRSVVAAHAGAEADHSVHVPGAVGVLAVQGAARVSLTTTEADILFFDVKDVFHEKSLL